MTTIDKPADLGAAIRKTRKALTRHLSKQGEKINVGNGDGNIGLE